MSLSSFGIFNHVPHKRYCVHRSYQSTLNNYIQLLDFANRRQAIPHGMLIQCPHSTPAPPTQHLKLLTGYGRGPFQYGCTIVVSHTGKEIKWKTLLHQLVLLIFFWGICPIETLQVTITAMLAVPREQTELLGFFASMVAVQMKRRMLKSIIYVFGLHPRYFNMCISWYIAVDMKSGLNSQSRDDLFVLRPSSPTHRLHRLIFSWQCRLRCPCISWGRAEWRRSTIRTSGTRSSVPPASRDRANSWTPPFLLFDNRTAKKHPVLHAAMMRIYVSAKKFNT